MAQAPRPEGASFRDPSGHVYDVRGRILRTVTEHAAADYEAVAGTGLLERLIEDGRLIETQVVDGSALGAAGQAARYVLEHARVPFLSYPYEWPFPALKAAALLQLDLQLEALEAGVALSDASAYNVQFRGARPVFIDYLSFRPYREGEFWDGHRQFCEQFLNPLLLRALLGVPYNAWYRGSLEGISAAELSPLLHARHKLSWKVMSHVVLQARLQRSALGSRRGQLAALKGGKLPRHAFRGMLEGLRRWIARLEPAGARATVWSDYAQTHSYASAEEQAKRAAVAEFVGKVAPGLLWDLGCNTGAYSELALESGAGSVVGFDFDQGALEQAFARAQAKDLAFLPLFLDAANPSPDQGWSGEERKGLQSRAKADAILALAFIHHLAIGRNVPLDRLAGWLAGLAPNAMIEFVEKGDPTVQQMLELRRDIFPDYTLDNFLKALSRHGAVERTIQVSQAGRTLVWFARR